MPDMSIKEAREGLERNQTQMAKIMGVHRNLWLKWERKDQGISAAPMRLIEILVGLKRNFPDAWKWVVKNYGGS